MVKPREQEEAKEGLIGVGVLHLFSCPKGGTDSGWLQQKCLGLCLGLEGRARPPGSPQEGSWQPSLLDQAKMGFSLSVQRWGPGQNSPWPALSTHIARECSSQGALGRHVSQVQPGPRWERPCWDRATPRSQIHPLLRQERT